MTNFDDIMSNHPIDISSDGFQDSSAFNNDQIPSVQPYMADASGAFGQHIAIDTDGDGQPDIHQSMVDQNHDGQQDHFVQYVDVDHPTYVHHMTLAEDGSIHDQHTLMANEHVTSGLSGQDIAHQFEDANHNMIPDHLELDMNDNGIPDHLEMQDYNHNMIPDQYEIVDMDHNSIPDQYDVDLNHDGVPDHHIL